MQAIVETLESVDENSKKILFKHFDQNSVNILGIRAPIILENLQKLAEEAKDKKLRPIDSDDLESDSSGNISETDEMNQIVEIQKLHRNIEKMKHGLRYTEQTDSMADMSYYTEDSPHQLGDINFEQESNKNLLSNRHN